MSLPLRRRTPLADVHHQYNGRSMSGSSGTVHILMVDDDRAAALWLAHGLREAGYQVTEASDGAGALEVLASKKPDLALLDVHMPGMSGIQLAERLNAQRRLPFIFMTGSGDADVVEHVTALGALGYLLRPLELAQVIPAIEAALARAAEIESLESQIEQLTRALDSAREVSIALGILMERHQFGSERAFELLRSQARNDRRRVYEVASDIVNAIDAIHRK